MTTRREFLLLADTFNADKHDPIGMIGSEKLDGNRVFWDGGISRGDDTVNVPWASTVNPKTGKRKDKVKPVATGLWSRYGNPIQAPDWFLDRLPPEPVDGELYAGRGNFQLTQTIVRRDDPNAGDWSKIRLVAFAAPTLRSVFQSGLIKNANMLCNIELDHVQAYVQSRGFGFHLDERTYLEELDVLHDFVAYDIDSTVFDVVHTEVINSMADLDIWVKYVTEKGGEGVMLRDPDSVWYPKRKPFLLKVKPRHDSEATITGFFAGEKGKTGHLLGKLGGIHCVWHGDPTAPCGLLKAPVLFKIGSGFTYKDRELDPLELFETACENPGADLDCVWTGQFKIGDRITFSYMGLTNDNVPREPTYLRKREDS